MGTIKKVISQDNIRTRLPLWSTIVAALALDYWNAPEWLIGASALLIAWSWALSIRAMIIQEDVDIFKDKG